MIALGHKCIGHVKKRKAMMRSYEAFLCKGYGILSLKEMVMWMMKECSNVECA
jgi:hypothetical protein